MSPETEGDQRRTGIVLATGPSLTPEQLDTARQAQRNGCLVFGMNRVYQDYPTLDVFLSCNPEFYDTHWNRGLKDIPADKWTWHKPTAEKYGIRHIEGVWKEGFSRDPRYLHLGHSSGFQLPGLAYSNYGCRRLLLLGYDMSFAPDYDGRKRKIGSKPRHYFGEYDPELQHWPSVKIRNGVFFELINQFERVKSLNPDLEIINCTPGSAMTCFPSGSIAEYV